MSAEHDAREGEEPRPKENPTPGEDQEAAGGPPAKPGAKPYVFKFKPADPKNDLEFEDMADK